MMNCLLTTESAWKGNFLKSFVHDIDCGLLLHVHVCAAFRTNWRNWIYIMFKLDGDSGYTSRCLGVHSAKSKIIVYKFMKQEDGYLLLDGYLLGVQGWRSGESTRLPPMWPGFDSQTRRHMWVEFVGSLLCTERFSPGTPVSPLLKNQHLT